MIARTIIMVAITTSLTACAGLYDTPDELRAQGKYKISATIEAEHVMLYTEVIKQMRYCFDRGSFRVTNDNFGSTSVIFVGFYYVLYHPKITYVIDMKAVETKTEVVVTGVNEKITEGMVEGMKLFAAGKPDQMCE